MTYVIKNPDIEKVLQTLRKYSVSVAPDMKDYGFVNMTNDLVKLISDAREEEYQACGRSQKKLESVSEQKYFKMYLLIVILKCFDTVNKLLTVFIIINGIVFLSI